MPTAYCLLLTAYCQLLTANCIYDPISRYRWLLAGSIFVIIC